MDDRHFIRIGLHRLRHPLPPVKLRGLHALADALHTDIGELVWQEYLTYLSNLSLESEAAEALMVAFLARNSPLVNTAAIRRVLKSPSPISDFILMAISGQPSLINVWSKAHSGQAPEFYAIAEEATKLTQPRIVPPIVRIRLERLEQMSGLPFVRQWEYEVERLISRLGLPIVGTFEYWTQGSGNVAQVFPRPSHFARSAFLRTLSLAFDMWAMPEEDVYEEAGYVIPGNLIYTQMPPGTRPQWADRLVAATITEESQCGALVLELIKECTDSGNTLLHLNAPLQKTEVYDADLRIISCYVEGDAPVPQESLRLHDFFLNKGITFAQEDADSLEITVPSLPPMPLGNGTKALPAIAPAPMHNVGYLTTDLVPRFPYLLVPYKEGTVITGTPSAGTLGLEMDGTAIGALKYWNQRWQPSHPSDASTPCGIALVVNNEQFERLAPAPSYKLRHFWELTIHERENSYSDWNERVLHGAIE